MASLAEHADRLQEVLDAAFEDGFYIDNGDGDPIFSMDLNTDGMDDWIGIDVPQ